MTAKPMSLGPVKRNVIVNTVANEIDGDTIIKKLDEHIDNLEKCSKPQSMIKCVDNSRCNKKE